MRNVFITFRSVTYAQRGEKLLSRSGIRCSLQRTPKWMETQGCGYSLRMHPDNVAEALALLRREKIPIGKVYAGMDPANLEELML